MNAEKLLSLGLLTVMVVTTPFATFNSANATDNIANSTVTPTHGQTEMLLAGNQKKEHTSNARPSTAEKHQKGEKAKKEAQINKAFKAAKLKDSKLSKDTFLRNYKE